MALVELWYHILGLRSYNFVNIPSHATIAHLREEIHQKERPQVECAASQLILRKVDADLRVIEGVIEDGRYRPDLTDDQKLFAEDTISDVWSEKPQRGRLHVLVSPPAGMGSPTLVYGVGNLDSLREYGDIFVKVNKWGRFEQTDLARNRIVKAQPMAVPKFVKTFEQKLVRKPRLHFDTLLEMSKICRKYFGLSWDPIAEEDKSREEMPYAEPLGDSIAEDESHEERRYAGLLEVAHTALHITLYNWENFWLAEGSYKCPLQGHVANSVFFDPFIRASKNSTATAVQNKRLPISIIVKCESEGVCTQPRKFNPRPEFHISNSALPRLLVEVNSTPGNSCPTDLVRMLTTGAFIVRFANKFVSAFCQKRNFVLCAIFDNGGATRYTLFQKQQIGNNEVVYYNAKTLSLNDSDGRVDFARHLYNLLCVELDEDQDQDTRDVIQEFNSRVEECNIGSTYTNDVANNTGRKRTRRDDCGHAGARGTGGGYDRAQLRARGYEVKSEVIVDGSGCEWEPLFKRPDHILTVYQPLDSVKEFIAKKIREGSHEPEMFRLLDAIPLKSDHVISLIDSFHGWAILPKMVSVNHYVHFAGAGDISESEVSQVCSGLIEGLAYLHKHYIAHRDIKPDNLVLDKNFCLKIIDFDIARQVQDEDEEVDDQSGTENWMAPEVEKKLKHSPIRADRWACGRVLLFLLRGFRKEDKPLREFAKNLMARNPKQRPSLLEWRSYSALLFQRAGHVLNIDANARKTSWFPNDPVEVDVDGENAKPSDNNKRG